MRKEVQAGAVIGGILIAVMAVYSIVASRGHADKKKDQVVLDSGKTNPGDATGGSTSPEAAGPSHDDRNDPLVVLTHDPLLAVPTPPAAPAHTDDSATPAPAPASGEGKSATNWAALLSDDHVENVAPLRTHTPEAARTAANPPAQSTDDATTAGHLNAGDPPTHLPPSDPPANPPSDSHANPPAPTAPGSTYHIVSGDTFSSIAQAIYGNAKYYKEIIKANPKVDPSHLKPGMVITLPDKSQFKRDAAPPAPAADAGSGSTEAKHHSTPPAATAINPSTEYRVQSSDSLYRISIKLYHSANKVDAIYQLNKSTIGADPAKLKLNMVLKLPEPPTQTASRA